jgi:hypothetical protein
MYIIHIRFSSILSVDNIRMDLSELEWGIWTGFVWLRIGIGGELM